MFFAGKSSPKVGRFVRRAKKITAGGAQVDWWIWVIVVIAAVMLVVDWLIVMGADPRRWKGGKTPTKKPENRI